MQEREFVEAPRFNLCPLMTQAPSPWSRNGQKLSGFVLCGSGISLKRRIHCETASSCRDVVGNIQDDGYPRKKVERIKPARIKAARRIQTFSHE